MSWCNDIDLSTLIGKTFVSVEVNNDRDEITFKVADDEVYTMYHSQDCCESVGIDDIEGNLQDLVGTPITFADSPSSEGVPQRDEYEESFTWTFYKFGTVKGFVDIRWYGSSNGYYSESVTFARTVGAPQ